MSPFIGMGGRGGLCPGGPCAKAEMPAICNPDKMISVITGKKNLCLLFTNAMKIIFLIAGGYDYKWQCLK